jgi:hypothetical protein
LAAIRVFVIHFTVLARKTAQYPARECRAKMSEIFTRNSILENTQTVLFYHLEYIRILEESIGYILNNRRFGGKGRERQCFLSIVTQAGDGFAMHFPMIRNTLAIIIE